MGYIKTMEYYSAVKKNEILPLAATLMDLGSVKCFSGSLVVKKKKNKKKTNKQKKTFCRRQEMWVNIWVRKIH